MGMYYEDVKMFIIIYDEPAQLLGENIIDNYTFSSRKYKDQAEIVKDILKKYLEG